MLATVGDLREALAKYPKDARLRVAVGSGRVFSILDGVEKVQEIEGRVTIVPVRPKFEQRG